MGYYTYDTEETECGGCVSERKVLREQKSSYEKYGYSVECGERVYKDYDVVCGVRVYKETESW